MSSPPPDLIELFTSFTRIGHVPEIHWRRWWSVCVARAGGAAHATVEAYLRAALVDSEERGRLLEAVISRHTWSFRDQAQLLELVAHLAACGNRRLRVWTAGCSTGEEPASLLLLLRKRGLTAVDLLASDISRDAVDAAKAALTTDEGPTRVRVALHDLIQQPPLETGFDAILCRNVLMYYERGAARAALARLVGALAENGRVFVGATDLLGIGRGGEPSGLVRDRARALPAVGVGAPVRPPVNERAGAPPPTEVPRLLAEAQRALGSRQLDRADELLLLAEGVEPDCAELHYLRGVTLRKRGNAAAALASLRRATFLDPTLWAAFLLLADEWRRAGHPLRADAAEQAASRLLEARTRSAAVGSA